MPPTTPGQGPGNGEAASQARRGTPRPARQYRPGRGRHVENTVMSALVRAGLVPRSCLLTTRGRNSGLPRANPVVPVEHGGRRWLVDPYGPVSWVRNAHAAGRVSLTRRRDTRHYTIREASPDEAGPVLRRYVRLAPSARSYFQATKDSRRRISPPRQTATPCSSSHRPMRTANAATLDADGQTVLPQYQSQSVTRSQVDFARIAD